MKGGGHSEGVEWRGRMDQAGQIRRSKIVDGLDGVQKNCDDDMGLNGKPVMW